MVDFEIYTDKIAESGRRLIRQAYEEAKGRNHKELTPEHLFLSFAEVERSLFNEVMQSLNLDPHAVVQALDIRMGRGDHLGTGVGANQLRPALQNALQHAREQGRRLMESTDLFYELFTDEQSYPVELLSRLGAGRKTVLKEIETHR